MKHLVSFWAITALGVWAADVPSAAHKGFIVVTDTVTADGNTDVADSLQTLIDSNPNRTLYFPDGIYLLSKPILTSAHPNRSVDIQLSNYAVIKAAPDWNSSEAMVRLGGREPANDIRTNGSNYSFTGGIVDGSGRAVGISIDSGRETAIRRVSIKHTRVGIHVKVGANSRSSDSDIADVNIIGNRATNSIGVLVEGYDCTFTGMRISDVHTGFLLKSAGNSLRNIHPLYTCGYGDYNNSCGFNDRAGNNWYSFCYADHFGVGFITAPGKSSTYDSCFCMWYAAHDDGYRHTVFRAEGSFDSVVNNLRIGFYRRDAVNTVLEEGRSGVGKGFFQNLFVNKALISEPEHLYEKYLLGRSFFW